jgi:hypothetical protein
MSANTNYAYTSLANMASGPHARWRRILLIALVPLLCAFAYFAFESHRAPSYKGSQYVSHISIPRTAQILNAQPDTLTNTMSPSLTAIRPWLP